MAKDALASASPLPTHTASSVEASQRPEMSAESAKAVKNGGGSVKAFDEAQHEGHAAKTNEAEDVEDESGLGDTTVEPDTKEGDAVTHEGAKGNPGPNGTPAQPKKAKRKSTTGIPEHKSRKVNKKKSQVLTHLDAMPGDIYLAHLRGHPIWPVVIPDEEMLPQAILASRPKSARRPDGTFGDDFADGGKRVNERSFPVMFLGGNEFSWISNTDLLELNVDAIGEQAKKSKKQALKAAYEIAAEKHDLAWFKNVLKERTEAAEAETEEAVEAEPKKSKGKRKSKAAEEEAEDIDMEAVDEMELDDDVEPEKKSKPRKRKKDVDSEGEGSKPVKTPKRRESTKTTTPKLKLSNPKTPNGASASKSTPKSGSNAKGAKSKGSSGKKSGKKAKVEDNDESLDEEAKSEEKPMSVAESREKRQIELLFLRHKAAFANRYSCLKLQKGFLTRDQPPREEEMQNMSDYIAKLERYDELEVSIIRATKINKVLKAIVKLASIPKDEDFNFRQRSYDLLQTWNQLIAREPETPTAGVGTNGNGTGANGVSQAENIDDEGPEKDDSLDVDAAEKEASKIADTAGVEDDAVKNAATDKNASMGVDTVEKDVHTLTEMAEKTETLGNEPNTKLHAVKPAAVADQMEVDESKPHKPNGKMEPTKVGSVVETIEAVESTA